MANKNQKNNKNNKNNKAKQSNTSKTNVNKTNKVNTDEKKETVKKETTVEKINNDKKVNAENKASTKENKKREFKLTSTQKDIVLILLVVVLLVVAFVVTGIKNPKLDIELPVTLEGEAGFTEITYSEYEEKMSEDKPFLVVIVKDGCSYCEAYEPIVKEIASEYSLPIYYINLTNLNSEEYDSLSKSNSYLRNQQWGTPTTLLMYGNAVVDSIGGYVEKDKFVESMIEENIKVEKDAE